MKECSKCKKIKELDEFYCDSKIKSKPRSACKECYIEWRNTKGREKQYKKRYGISIEDYNMLFNNQNGCCAICKKHQSQFDIALAVDHNHESNKVRGLLCFNCNQGIGRFKEKIENLQEAISYLLRHND